MTLTALLIEDDATIAEPLVEGLGRYGLTVGHVSTGAAGLRGPYGDIVLLDLGLPDMDGIDVCRGIRQVSDVPIIMLTARGAEADRVLGLELGADDYLAKPFSIRELIARIRAVTRRTGGGALPPPQPSYEPGTAEAGPPEAASADRGPGDRGSGDRGSGDRGPVGPGPVGPGPADLGTADPAASGRFRPFDDTPVDSMPVWPGTPEPAPADASFVEPAYSGASYSDPLRGEPTYTELGRPEPRRAEPGGSGPGGGEPWGGEGWGTERAPESGRAEGRGRQPGGEPWGGEAWDTRTRAPESGRAEPGRAEPPYQEPSYPEARYGDPAYNRPVYGDSRQVDPRYVEASYTEPVPLERAAPAPAPAAASAAGPRQGSAPSPVGALVVDRRTRQVWVGDTQVTLTPKEFDLLALLTEDPGAVYSRQQILDQVWDPNFHGPTKTLDVHVATLRRKLGNPAWIQTLRGVGFRLAVRSDGPGPERARP